MDDSANELLCFLVWPLQRQQWTLLCNCLLGALPFSHYAMQSFPLCGVRVLHPAQYDLLDNHQGDRQKQKQKQQKKRHAGCLSHAVIGMFYSVVANQRQPQYTYNVLQHRRQPRPTININMIYRGGGASGGWEGFHAQKRNAGASGGDGLVYSS